MNEEIQCVNLDDYTQIGVGGNGKTYVNPATSGSTLNEILRTLRILNEDNTITIFSLIGRKDLMAETI